MIFLENSVIFFLLLFIREYGSVSAVPIARDKQETNATQTPNFGFEKSFFDGDDYRSKNLQQEIFEELNQLSIRKQREIFDDLEKQQKELDSPLKTSFLLEPEYLSPLNAEELKKVQKTIKTSNGTLPTIRNKRTLNFLLRAVARAMGYSLVPNNPDAEWLPRQKPPAPPRPSSTAAPPCPTTPPPCRPPSPSPSPCPMPTAAPPCPMTQYPTVPPNQIDANTISYPFRPARTIPLLNFAPLPVGVDVPYPALLQNPASPCGTTPAPAPPPCATPAPKRPPCTTPAPAPPPCATPAPKRPPCTTPAPAPPPCATSPAPTPPPCATPAPKRPPCTTPAPTMPPCPTTPAPPPPCGTPAPPPSPSTPPCGAPVPPPAPPSSVPKNPSSPPPPPPPPERKPKKGRIFFEYDDPIRIHIYSDGRKILPASGNVYSGLEDGYKENSHSYFFPTKEESRNKEDDVEEEEEIQEERVEAHEDDEDKAVEKQEDQHSRLRYHEDEDERLQHANTADDEGEEEKMQAGNNEEEPYEGDEEKSQVANKEEVEEEEKDESETSLSFVKRPMKEEIEKKHRRRLVSYKSNKITDKNNDKGEKTNGDTKAGETEKSEDVQITKKPKRKKWVRIVKKQRRKTKTDSNPQENFHVHTSDNDREGFESRHKIHGRSTFLRGKDVQDLSAQDTEGHAQIELKKIFVNNKQVPAPEVAREARRFASARKAPETESERRKQLEQAVERYVEDYIEKQLGDELLKNTGRPKTTVFEFVPKDGPKIKTITKTVAKTTRVPGTFHSRIIPDADAFSPAIFRETGSIGPNGRTQSLGVGRGGLVNYDSFATRSK